MELKDCITQRRSIRRYEDRPLPKETVEAIVSLAARAPSWKNTQVSRWIVVTDRAVIERIAAEGVLGFTHNADILRGCAALAVQSVLNMRSGYERDGSFSTSQGRHWESFDAGIAAQTFCLAAHDLGVGTCILGVYDERTVAGIIDLPEGQSVASLIPMGYPAEAPNPTPRKDLDTLLRFI